MSKAGNIGLERKCGDNQLHEHKHPELVQRKSPHRLAKALERGDLTPHPAFLSTGDRWSPPPPRDTPSAPQLCRGSLLLFSACLGTPGRRDKLTSSGSSPTHGHGNWPRLGHSCRCSPLSLFLFSPKSGLLNGLGAPRAENTHCCDSVGCWAGQAGARACWRSLRHSRAKPRSQQGHLSQCSARLQKGAWAREIGWKSQGLRGKLWDFISYKTGCSALLVLKEPLAAFPYSPPRGRSIQKGKVWVENFLKLGKPATASSTKSHLEICSRDSTARRWAEEWQRAGTLSRALSC